MDGIREITFTVPTLPVAQPRQRTRIVDAGGRQYVHNYTPVRHPVAVFKAACQYAANQHLPDGFTPLAGPVAVWLIFVLPRPKRLCWKTRPTPRAWCDRKPDLDNLTKSCTDSLTGILWRDDAQIVWCNAQKLYAAGDEAAHVEIRVRELLPGGTDGR